MKKRVVTIMIALALMIACGSPAAYATSASIAAKLEDKTVYHTEQTDYISGDCVLTATRMMIKRAAILNNYDGWTDMTNESLRYDATEYGLMHNCFSHCTEGITYEIASGSFNEENCSDRAGEFAELLKKHPEGIVVYGPYAAETGSHGVLVVEVKNGQIYAVDSATNTGDLNEGIQKWEDTIMLDPSLCTDYWCISGISGGKKKPVYDPNDKRHITLFGMEIKFA